MIDWVRRVAPSRLPVLVLGESGVGKEVIAGTVHALSPRAAGPWLAINCAALPDSLLDAELFGALRGAYTDAHRDRPGLFDRARGGSLFLDEAGDMSPAMQAKLLRVLESRRIRPVGGGAEIDVDVRLIAATNRDLAADVAQGRFREDLYYRIAMVKVRVPPLRDRLEDLPLLVEALAPRLAADTGCSGMRISPCAWTTLATHDWPGNVRELHAVLAEALLRNGGGEIRGEDLRLLDPRRPPETPLEQRMIESALAACENSLTRAAARIGWTRQKLYRRMAALEIRRTRLH